MIVIGLSGYAGSGKTTVADILVRDHGFTKMSFADPIKRMVRALNPIIGYDVYECDCGDPEEREIEEIRLSDATKFGFAGDTIKYSPWAEEVRELWQRFGTDVIRAEDPDFWVNAALKDMAKVEGERIVFDDVRFPNEAKMIHDLNGPFWAEGELSFSRISGSIWQIARYETQPDRVEDIHESERYVGQLDEEIVIVNEAGVDDLAETVVAALAFVAEDEVIFEQPALWEDDAELVSGVFTPDVEASK
ncbi:MAG TPA: hypothetical protein VNA32_04620 [Actinomycetota bacterium]|nr:hypothetical protein [Actinomycetota bacterium]